MLVCLLVKMKQAALAAIPGVREDDPRTLFELGEKLGKGLHALTVVVLDILILRFFHFFFSFFYFFFLPCLCLCLRE